MRLNECECPRTYACAGFILLEELWILIGSSHSRIPPMSNRWHPRREAKWKSYKSKRSFFHLIGAHNEVLLNRWVQYSRHDLSILVGKLSSQAICD